MPYAPIFLLLAIIATVASIYRTRATIEMSEHLAAIRIAVAAGRQELATVGESLRALREAS